MADGLTLLYAVTNKGTADIWQENSVLFEFVGLLAQTAQGGGGLF